MPAAAVRHLLLFKLAGWPGSVQLFSLCVRRVVESRLLRRASLVSHLGGFEEASSCYLSSGSNSSCNKWKKSRANKQLASRISPRTQLLSAPYKLEACSGSVIICLAHSAAVSRPWLQRCSRRKMCCTTSATGATNVSSLLGPRQAANCLVCWKFRAILASLSRGQAQSLLLFRRRWCQEDGG